MRLLVKLAKLKDEQQENPKNKKKKGNIRRGNTLTSARSKQTPEEIIARRISHYADKSGSVDELAPSAKNSDANKPQTRVRSYSDPKAADDNNVSV